MSKESQIGKLRIAASQKTKERDYWLNQLSGEPHCSGFPGDTVDSSSQKPLVETFRFLLSESVSSSIIRMSAGSDVRLHVILTAGLTLLVSIYTGYEDIILGCPINKPKVEVDFINTVLPLRNRVKGAESFKELLMQVKQTVMEAGENRNYPMGILAEQLGYNEIKGALQLFDTALLLENIHDRKYLDHLKLNAIFAFIREESGVSLTVRFDSVIYKRAMVERICSGFETLLKQVLADMDAPLADCHFLSIEEKQKIVEEFNHTQVSYPADKSIHRLFTEQSEYTPHAVALMDGNEAQTGPLFLSYKFLNSDSDRLARALIDKGLRPGALAALMVERSPAMITGILAILKTGAGYVPLDMEYPGERKSFILEDCCASILVTREGVYVRKDSALKPAASHMPLLVFGHVKFQFSAPFNGHIKGKVELDPGSPQSPAYVMYTSGSTGTPKGVLVEHRNVVRLVMNTGFVDLSAQTRILLTGAPVFDATTFEIWGALLNGGFLGLVSGSVILDGNRLGSALSKYEINTMWLTSSLFNRLMQEDNGIFAGLVYLLVGGDVLTPRFINLARQKYPDLQLINGYGPTENTTFSTIFKILKDYLGDIPIGKPIANSTAYILDKYMRPMLPGVWGELWVGGDGVSRGYLNNPELTAQKFTTDPFAPGGHLYRTGDQVCRLPDGNIEFAGRIDRQVKIRGFRVEPGEIEAILVGHERITQAVVTVGEKEGDKYLCAYVTGRESRTEDLRAFLWEALPAYMVPSYFVKLEEMPLTANGKIDRNALPEPRVTGAGDYIAPRGLVERQLAHIWQDILHLEPTTLIGLDDNFFDLGGHSLKATTLISRVYAEFAVNIKIDQVFSHPTIRELAPLVTGVDSAQYEERLFVALEPAEKREYYPLSPSQRRLYILQQAALESISYNIPTFLVLAGELDERKFTTVFNRLIQRHESLRTSFHIIAGEPVQRVCTPGEIDFSLERVTGDWDTEVEIFVRPFDLSEAPLFRVALSGSKASHLLMVDMHHIVSDGTSMGVLVSEFMELYAGGEAGLLPVRYCDFALWHHHITTGEAMGRQREYWQSQFTGEIPVLELPLDFLRPFDSSFQGDTVEFQIDSQATAVLKSLAKEEGATLFMVIMAAFSLLLSRLSGSEDVIVGTPSAGRNRPGLDRVIGMFVNTLALRMRPRGGQSFRQYVAQVKECTLQAMDNQDYPFEELVEYVEQSEKLDKRHHPLFDVMFAMQNLDIADIHIPGLKLSPYPYKNKTAKFDLTLLCHEDEERLSFSLEYRPDLFTSHSIGLFIDYFKRIISRISQPKDRSISQIEILSQEQKQELLSQFCRPEMDFPAGKTIQELFREQAQKYPLAPALAKPDMGDDGLLDYGQLDRLSDQLAYLLKDRGVGSGEPIAILFNRSLEMIIAMLGILKSGGCYVPLDPKAPHLRLSYILEEAGASLLLSGVNFEEDARSITGISVFVLDKNNLKDMAGSVKPFTLAAEADPGANSPAYVIFTSGSTGKPKGVPVSHNNVCPLLSWGRQSLGMGPNDKTMQNLSHYFDWSVWEIFITLTTGACLFIGEEQAMLDSEFINRFISQHQITVLHATPTQYGYLESTGMDQESLKYLFIGAEKLTLDLVDRAFFAVRPECRVFNMYGLTETAIISTVLEINPQSYRDFAGLSSVPIGKPVSGNDVYVFDKYFNLCPLNVLGELVIGGSSPARGYLNDPEKTAGAFILNRFLDQGVRGDRLYRTGDLARFVPGGYIEFLGRRDQQVKIRGFRIEPGEIESLLKSHPSVKEALVIVRQEDSLDSYLCAYLVVSEVNTQEEFFIQELRDHLADGLPGYMIPAAFVVLERIPLNPNGKVDIKALPKPTLYTAKEYVAPCSQVERQLVDIWRDILRLEPATLIGLDDNFFDLGGHSLKATTLISRIFTEFAVNIKIDMVFSHPTIGELATLLTGVDKITYVEIPAVEKKEYYPLSYAQRRLWVLCQFEEDSTAYNMPLPLVMHGHFDTHTFQWAVTRLIKRHESLRTVFELVDGDPFQRVIPCEDVDFRYDRVDLCHLSLEEREKMAREIYMEFSNRTFDLEKGPLLQFKLLKLEEENHLLIMNIHHIVNDGWSQGNINNELLTLYNSRANGGEDPLAPLKLHYKDYSCWHNDLIKEGRFSNSQSYWLEKFKDKPNGVELPLDHSRKPIQTFNGGRVSFVMGPDMTAQLHGLSREHDATLYMTLLSLLKIFMYKYTGQEDIITGAPIAGRKRPELYPLIGFLVNTLVFRCTVDPEESFTQLLARIKQETLDCYEHQDYPFDLLIEQLGLDRDLSQSPLFNVMLAHNNSDTAEESLEISGITLSDYSYIQDFNMSKFDLTFFLDEMADWVQVRLEYNSDLFERSSIERMAENFLVLVGNVIDSIESPVFQHHILTQKQYKELVEVFNGHSDPFSSETLQELFENQTEKTPLKIALADTGQNHDPGKALDYHTVTYRQLNERANRLAHYLRQERQVQPNQVIGISIDRSIHMIVAILGVIKSGAGYLALDPGYPKERILHVLSDSRVDLVLTHRIRHELFQGYPGDIVELKDLDGALGEMPTTDPPSCNLPEHVLYVNYTSGSTGTPNGAMLSHGILGNLIKWQHKHTQIDCSLRCLQFTSINFCVSFQEILGTLTRGGELHLVGDVERQDIDYLMSFLSNRKIEILYLPFSYLNFLFNESSRWNQSFDHSLKHIITAGEQLKITVGLKGFLDKNPHIKLHNHYGSTEMHVVTSYTLDAAGAGQTPIPPAGKPIHNVSIYILDDYLNPVPMGVWGEIFVKGSYQVMGYIGNPSLTEKKVIAHGKFSADGVKLYRSGDIGRWLPDGNIELRGRKDSQVKIRGFRVEPGEIESRILAMENIRECVVVVKEDPKGQNFLAAYVVLSGIDTALVKRKLGNELPQYMLPMIIELDHLPLMPNGKVDRGKLPEPALDMEEVFTAPRDRLEECLAGIWAGILGLEKDLIGIDSNFFELGGHSLKATLIISEIQKQLKKKIPLVEMFKAPTIKDLSAFIRGVEESGSNALKPAPQQEFYPLSPAQKRLYILQQIDGENKGYNMPVVVVLEGELDIEKFSAALIKLIDRHESLRTSFHMKDEAPVQKIHQIGEVPFQLEEFSFSGEKDSATVDQAIASFVRPFDVTSAPLLRAGLAKDSANPLRHVLMFDMHHIISDGTSLGIMTREFMALYGGETPAPLQVQYKDYAFYLQSEKAQKALEGQREFWLQQFLGQIPVLDLPKDYPRPPQQRFFGRSLSFEIDPSTTALLNQIARNRGATLYMVLLAAFNILFSRLSGQEDIVIGTPTAGRGHADLDGVIGMFINTLSMRNFPIGEKRFLDFLGQVKDSTLAAFENQDYPFEELVEQVNVARDASRNSLFDVMFAFQNMDITPIEIPGLKLSPYPFESKIAKFDLTLQCYEDGDRLLFIQDYCTDLFSGHSVGLFIDYFKRILVQIALDPGKRIGEFELLAEEEKTELLSNLCRSGFDYSTGKTIQELFREQTRKDPAAPAIVAPGTGDDGVLSYEQLDLLSDLLASDLKERGVSGGDLVALLFNRSVQMVIGILGVLKRGCCYVPLDPHAPDRRLTYLLEDCKPTLLLSGYDLEERALAISKGPIYVWDRDNLSGIDSKAEQRLLSSHDTYEENSLAYMIFTSGSTGKPKGVPISHRNICPLLAWGRHDLGMGPGDRTVHNVSYYFDFSVWEIFITLTTGACLYTGDEQAFLAPDFINRFIADHQVTLLHVTPTQYRYLAGTGMDHNSLRYLFIGGEKLTIDLVERVFQLVSESCRVFNMYGLTETSIISTAIEINRESYREFANLSNIPIGKPIAGNDIYILDKFYNLCPLKVPGELVIGGSSPARGYLNDPEKTAGAFIVNRFKDRGFRGHRLYRSGDMARFVPGGNIEFLGRRDQQVKIRGFRIEPGEIESRLMSHPWVKETVVIVRQEDARDDYLCAYLVLGEVNSAADSPIQELRDHLAEGLPSYMIPAAFIIMDRMPLNPNGKVDIKALPLPEATQQREYAAPGDELEERLVAIWQQVLYGRGPLPESASPAVTELPGFDIDDNFFEIGGHSLKATVLSAKMQKELNVKVALGQIFKYPTIRQLAGLLRESSGMEESFATISPAEVRDSYPLSAAQKRLYILQQMAEAQTGYNIPVVVRLLGEVDIERLTSAFVGLIERHESLRTSFDLQDGEPVQRIHSAREINFNIQVDQAVSVDDFIAPFDLAQAPLFRVGLFSSPGGGEAEQGWVLVVDMHHIISDGTSLRIIIREFAALYAGEELSLPVIQYKDYSQWRETDDQKDSLKDQETYWLNQFAGEIPVLDLPIDFPRPLMRSFAGRTINFTIPAKETGALREIARRQGVTLYMAVLTLFGILLCRLSGQEEVVVGTPVSGRRHADLELMIGMFVNTLCIKCAFNEGKTYLQVLEEIKAITLAALKNQDYPFEELVERLELPRHMGRNPLFDVMFTFQTVDNDFMEIPGLKIDSYDYQRNTAKFDLTLHVIEAVDNLYLGLEYSTDIFSQETMETYITYFERIVSGVIQNEEREIALLELLSPQEKSSMLVEFNQTETQYPDQKTIHELFVERALQSPESIAMQVGDQFITYGQLHGQSDCLARLLIERGIGSESIVGLMMQRSARLVTAILGVLKAGGAYLPMDPGYPEERKIFMLADSGAETVITCEGIFVATTGKNMGPKDLTFGPRTFQLVSDFDAPAKKMVDFPVVKPQNLAYIIYTSGSTGQPKGVMIEHRSLVNYVSWGITHYHAEEKRTYPLYTSISFDLTVTSIFLPLVSGNTILIYDQEDEVMPIRWVTSQGLVDTIKVTPAHLSLIVDQEVLNSPNIKTLIVGGEQLECSLAAAVSSLFPGDLEIYNEYGPTEATVGCMTYLYHEENDTQGPVPIGKPIANARIYVLDNSLRPVPVNVAGSLYIGGCTLARGYLGRPDLTADCFLDNPYVPGEKIYRTGDLAKRLANGNLVFLGRNDEQVKIRGFRIEPGEIVAQLLLLDGVLEAVVVDWEKSPGQKNLCAYLITEKEINVSEIRAALGRVLPAYMIPSYFTRLPEIPLTHNGKLDRKALPAPVVTLGDDFISPRTGTEERVARTWMDVLALKKVGVSDNFFDLGGNSLDFIKINKQLRESLKRDIPLVMMFRYPTVAALAKYLDSEEYDAILERDKDASGSAVGQEIAVIGIAARFPGAPNAADFWNNLINGVESISYFSDSELEEAGVDAGMLRNPGYVKAMGVLENSDYFDNTFFDYIPGESDMMDPQIRIFHETVWTALEDAGYDPGTYPGYIGLYAGAALGFNWQLLTMLSGIGKSVNPFASSLVNDKDFLTTRISYKLNLKGPSFAVSTACSTSLVAVSAACRSILSGECDMAVAGGVKVATPQKMGYLYQEGMIHSPDGHCRAFDAQAQGTIAGCGSGAVVLKGLDKALADGDHIYAVIKGAASNNDGIRKAGFTAPSIDGQAEVIRAALRQAEIMPETIGYVETHGTGTILGDPVEMAALKLAFNTPEKGYCALGSVKTNVGHLDTAAGICGFLKTVLMLHHKVIPPSLHYQSPNPGIDFEDSPFFINNRLRKWERGSFPLRAGVSSFGIGGTNAHLVLEEAPRLPFGDKGREYKLLLLSAKSPAVLDRMKKNLAEHLETRQEVGDFNLADAAYTLQTGRRPFKYRAMSLCRDTGDAISCLSTPEAMEAGQVNNSTGDPFVVFMYPGQGAQYVEMGLELYQEEAVFKGEFDRCADILAAQSGLDIRHVLYPQGSSDELAGQINNTEFTQPVIFAFEYALTKSLMSWGIKPGAMIGHSIGEFVAACLSGVFSLEDALALVALRGKLMQALPEGSMLSVPLGEKEMEELLIDRELSLAAVNSSRRCVVSGSHQEVERLARDLEQQEIQVRRLHTSHAFHSAMMEPVLADFRKQVEGISLRNPTIPYISNVTGRWIKNSEARDPAYWSNHIRRAVMFAHGLGELFREKDLLLIEVGPGKSLSTFVRQHETKPLDAQAINLVRHPREEESDLSYLLKRVGQLWLKGVSIDWNAFADGEKRYRIQLPTYPFQGRLCPVSGNPYKLGMEMLGAMGSLEKNPNMAEWFYLPSWERLPKQEPVNQEGVEPEAWLLFLDEEGVGNQVLELLKEEDRDVIVVRRGSRFLELENMEYSIDPANPDDYDSLFQQLALNSWVPNRIANFFSVTGDDVSPGIEDRVGPAQDNGLFSLLHLVQAIGRQEISSQMTISMVGDGLVEVTGSEELFPEKATLLGAVKIVPLEYPNIQCRTLDIDHTVIAAHLLAELKSQALQPITAIRGSFNWAPVMKPQPLAAPTGTGPRLREQGVYLITGGMGGMGFTLAGFLAETLKARLVLVGRSSFPNRDEWDHWLEVHGQEDPVSAKITKMREWEEAGAQVMIFSTDISDSSAMAELISKVNHRFGSPNGVLHTAGLADYEGVIQRRNRQMTEGVMAPKLQGTLVLHNLLKEAKLDFMMLFSSVGNILYKAKFGQVAYNAANEFLEAYATWRSRQSDCFVTTVNWCDWYDVGMSVAALQNKSSHAYRDEDVKDLLYGSVTPQEGVEVFKRILAGNQIRVSVSPQDLFQMLAHLEPGAQSEAAQEEILVTGPSPGDLEGVRPRELNGPYIPPVKDIEKVLVQIWQRFFGINPVGIEDDFFDMGGDSLQIMTVAAQIRKALNTEIPLQVFFARPTIKKLAEYIEENSQTSGPAVIEPAEEQDFYPLSSAQKRIYVLQHMDKKNTGYNQPRVETVEIEIHNPKVGEIFRKLIIRHESLRTSFILIDGEPVQKIHKPGEIEFEVEYFVNNEGNPQQIIQDFVRPFDLSRPPLFRAGLIGLEKGKCILMADLHHIISDGSSNALIFNEFIQLYKGEALKPLRLQYKDFSQWQNNRAHAGEILKQETYWTHVFSSGIPVLNLPIDYERPDTLSYEGGEMSFSIQGHQLDSIREICEITDSTMFMVLLAFFNVFLAKISGQEDVVTGTVTMGRSRPDLENIIGMFVNTLALRNFPSREKAFSKFVKEVKTNALDAFTNQDYQFEDLVDTLQVKRTAGRNPLFDVMFAYKSAKLTPQQADSTANHKGDEALAVKKNFHYRDEGSKFDLILSTMEESDRLLLDFIYSSSLFTGERIERFLKYFKEIVTAVTNDPHIVLKNIVVSHDLEEVKSDAYQGEEISFDF